MNQPSFKELLSVMPCSLHLAQPGIYLANDQHGFETRPSRQLSTAALTFAILDCTYTVLLISLNHALSPPTFIGYSNLCETRHTSIPNMITPLRTSSAIAALLLSCTTTVAFPAATTTLGSVPTPSPIQANVFFDNQGSEWSKRHGKGFLERRARLAQEDAELDKRYWQVTSVWIGTLPLLHASGFLLTRSDVVADDTPKSTAHRMTTTITVTVDPPAETSYIDVWETVYTDPPANTTSEAIATPSSTLPPTETSASSGAPDTAIARPAIVHTNATVVDPYTTPKQSSNGKLVFAHFMVGIVSTYALNDWVYDMTLASSYGIDGFALNIGKDDYTDAQLSLAYEAANGLGFKVFISVDVSQPFYVHSRTA